MNHRKKILLLFSEVCANGGIQRFNRTFLSACLRLDLQCDILSLRDTQASVARFPLPPEVNIQGFGGRRIRFALAAMRAICGNTYDYVLIGHINLLAVAVAALSLPTTRQTCSLLVAHGIEVWGSIGGARKRALQAVDKILCVSNFTRESVRSQAPRIAPDRFMVFPNALSETWLEKFAPPPASEMIPALPWRFLLSVTRLEKGDRYKGIVTVLEAMSMIEDESLHYVVVGRGDDLAFLQQVARQLGVSARTHWLGALSDAELVNLYRSCEAFVLPSGKEGFGIVFLEAMFFGAPVIAAREKGAVDVVCDAETGLTIEYGNVVALKRAIERLCGDPQLRAQLSSRARAKVVNDGTFTFRAFVARCAVALDIATGTTSATVSAPGHGAAVVLNENAAG